MTTSTLRRTGAAALAVAAIVSTAGCSRHLGTQPAATQGSPASTATSAATAAGSGSGAAAEAAATASQPAGTAAAGAAATAALATGIDRAGAAMSWTGTDLSASAGTPEGDPTK
jgi:hypothetical protein